MAPNWVFDVHGNKVGSMSFPWRITDYIREFYFAKTPIAIGNRSSKPWREKKMSRKPAAKRSASEVVVDHWLAPKRVRVEDAAVDGQVSAEDAYPSPESMDEDDFDRDS